MALETRHWITAAGLGCALLATALLPPAEQPGPVQVFFGARPFGNVWLDSRATDPLTARAGDLTTALQRAERRLGSARMRDSVSKLLSRKRDDRNTPVVLVLGQDARRAEPLFRTALDSAWVRVGAFHSSGPAPAVVLVDTSLVTKWGAGDWWLLAQGTEQPRCALVFVVPRRIPPQAPRQGLAPCLYYAAFGTPGPRIESWLGRRNFDFGLDAEWSLPAHDLPGGNINVSWWASPLGRSLRGEDGWWFAPDLNVIGCWLNRAEACRRALLDPPNRWPRHGSDVQGTIGNETLGFGTRGWDGVEGSLLADLIRSEGPERFTRFWRSPLPVDSAFASAFGTSIDDWSHRWAVRKLGQTFSGPVIRPFAAIAWLLLSLAAVGVAAAVATRRQVG